MHEGAESGVGSHDRPKETTGPRQMCAFRGPTPGSACSPPRTWRHDPRGARRSVVGAEGEPPPPGRASLSSADMGRYLAILNGTASGPSETELTEQEQMDFMQAWASWAQRNERALVDPGAPLFRKKRVTAQGVEDFTDTSVAYAIVEASAHDDAVRIFSGHPHLQLRPGNSISVMECPPVPS